MHSIKLLIIYLFLTHEVCFGEDIFFEKILLKSESQQLLLIQKRIKKDAEIETRLTTHKNIFFYLEHLKSHPQKFEFLNSVIQSSSQNSFKELAIKSIFSYCKTNLRHCTDGLPALLNCTSGTACQLIYQTALLELFDPVYLEYILNKHSLFAKILSFPFTEDNLIKKTFNVSVDFGFYSNAKNIIKKHPKTIESAEDTLFSKCNFLRQTNELKSSIECFGKQSNTWAMILKAYSHHLNGDPFDKNAIKLTLEKLNASDPSPRIREFSLVMMGLFFNEVKKTMTDTEFEQAASDYFNGYMLLSINKKYKFLTDKQSLEMLQLYARNFPNYLLTNILESKTTPQILISLLGTNHFLCKVLEP